MGLTWIDGLNKRRNRERKNAMFLVIEKIRNLWREGTGQTTSRHVNKSCWVKKKTNKSRPVMSSFHSWSVQQIRSVNIGC